MYKQDLIYVHIKKRPAYLSIVKRLGRFYEIAKIQSLLFIAK